MSMPMPEEFKQAMQDAMDRAQKQQMQHIADVLADEDALDDLSLEQLRAVANLLQSVNTCDRPRSVAAFYEGIFRGRMAAKWDVCAVHGVNHADEDLRKIQDEANATSDDQPTLGELFEKLCADLEQYEVGFVDDLDSDDMSSAEEYALLRAAVPVTCMNCGHRSASLNDRMLKKACPGCQHKAKFG